MREPRRVGLVKIPFSLLTEALHLDEKGAITGAMCHRSYEGGPIFLKGKWKRPSAIAQSELVRNPGEVAIALHLPPGTEIVDAWTDDLDDGLCVTLKVEGPTLAPVLRNQRVPLLQFELQSIPQPAGLPDQIRGRFVA